MEKKSMILFVGKCGFSLFTDRGRFDLFIYFLEYGDEKGRPDHQNMEKIGRIVWMRYEIFLHVILNYLKIKIFHYCYYSILCAFRPSEALSDQQFGPLGVEAIIPHNFPGVFINYL